MCNAYAVIVQYEKNFQVLTVRMTLKSAKEFLAEIATIRTNPKWKDNSKRCFTNDKYKYYIQPTSLQL